MRLDQNFRFWTVLRRLSFFFFFMKHVSKRFSYKANFRRILLLRWFWDLTKISGFELFCDFWSFVHETNLLSPVVVKRVLLRTQNLVLRLFWDLPKFQVLHCFQSFSLFFMTQHSKRLLGEVGFIVISWIDQNFRFCTLLRLFFYI